MISSRDQKHSFLGSRHRRDFHMGDAGFSFSRYAQQGTSKHFFNVLGQATCSTHFNYKAYDTVQPGEFSTGAVQRHRPCNLIAACCAQTPVAQKRIVQHLPGARPSRLVQRCKLCILVESTCCDQAAAALSSSSVS